MAAMTHLVPWVSSLRHGIRGLHFSTGRLAVDIEHVSSHPARTPLAVSNAKSSKYVQAFRYSPLADVTRVSRNWSYLAPRTRFPFRSKYEKLVRRSLLSMPQSRTTGNTRFGCIPAQKVMGTSFATDMRMPPQP